MDDQKKKVLIIEDEPPMMRVLTDRFTESGFTTLQASDGEAGLQSALTNHPDIIILDVLMPKLDGMGLMKKLREDERGKNTPVIILSNVSPDTDEILKAIMRDQPAYYLVKSNTQLSELIDKVKEILTGPPYEHS